MPATLWVTLAKPAPLILKWNDARLAAVYCGGTMLKLHSTRMIRFAYYLKMSAANANLPPYGSAR